MVEGFPEIVVALSRTVIILAVLYGGLNLVGWAIGSMFDRWSKN